MSPQPGLVAAALAERGLAATRVTSAEDPAELWLLTDWRALSAEATATLSAEEHARAARFRSEDLRARYRAAHAALRCLADARFGIPAAAQRYAVGERGKPYLHGRPDAHVSLSYGGDCVLIGLASQAIGVDIETLRPIEDSRSLAALHYAPSERWVLDQAAARSLTYNRLFLGVWTRKEACIKAAGLSIAEQPLSALDCGAWGLRTVRVGQSQLRTRTILYEHSRLISWALESGRSE